MTQIAQAAPRADTRPRTMPAIGADVSVRPARPISLFPHRTDTTAMQVTKYSFGTAGGLGITGAALIYAGRTLHKPGLELAGILTAGAGAMAGMVGVGIGLYAGETGHGLV